MTGTDNMEDLLVLMVEDARDRYMNAMTNLLHLKNGTRKFVHPDAVKQSALDTIFDVETFFCSEYGEYLTHIEGKRVMEALNARAKKMYDDMIASGNVLLHHKSKARKGL